MSPAIDERRLIFLLGAVQFVNVLDFMMVTPLGPDFAVALDIPSAEIGLVISAYTGAAAVAGILGALFLDRFGRRRALFVALLGLALGTLAGAFAWDMRSMIASRLVAGLFGGPATALTYSIIADVIPPERRGRALGAVMSAFTVAALLGVPAGLELARLISWHAPFVFTAVLILLAAAGSLSLPPLRDHVASARARGFDFSFLTRGLPVAALLLGATGFMGNFLVIPSISPYIQFNLGFPREYIGALYMAGGAVTFFAMRVAGWTVDRFGATRVSVVGFAMFATALVVGFVFEPALLPVPAFFVLFFISSAFRMVPNNTVMSRIPRPAERARYMSVQSAVQHLATTTGAVVASALLVERGDQSLDGMSGVAIMAIGLAAVMPLGLALIEPRVRRSEQASAVLHPGQNTAMSGPAQQAERKGEGFA